MDPRWTVVLIGVLFARTCRQLPPPSPLLFRGSSREFTRCTPNHKSLVITVLTHPACISISPSIGCLDKLTTGALLALLVGTTATISVKSSGKCASVYFEHRKGSPRLRWTIVFTRGKIWTDVIINIGECIFLRTLGVDGLRRFYLYKSPPGQFFHPNLAVL